MGSGGPLRASPAVPAPQPHAAPQQGGGGGAVRGRADALRVDVGGLALAGGVLRDSQVAKCIP